MTHNDRNMPAGEITNVQRCPWCGSSYRNMIGDDLWWQCGSRTSRQSWGCREVSALRADVQRLTQSNARWQVIAENATEDNARMANALYRIGNMPTEPRPDGTFNYDRTTIIEMAREALGE